MLLNNVLDSLSDAVILVRPDGIIAHCNREVKSIFGYTPDELIGSNISVLIPTDKKQDHAKLQDQYFAKPDRRKMGSTALGTIYGIQKNGSKIPIEVSLSHTTIGNEKLAIAIIADISARLQEKQELERSRAIYASLVESSSDHIFRIDTDGRIVYINHTAPGLDREKVIGSHLLDFIPTDEMRKVVGKVIHETFTEGKQQTYNTSYPSPVGELHYTTLISPIIEAGKIIGASLISRDNTEEVKKQNKIQEQESFIRNIHNHSLNGVYIYDFSKGKNTYINSRYSEILGYSLEEIHQMSEDDFFSLFHEDDYDNIKLHMTEISQLKEGQSSEIEYRFKTKQGDWIWCYSRDTVFEYTPEKKVKSFIGAFTDISDQKQFEESLLQTNKELEDFVSITSHDLKSPLISVSKLLGLLKEDLDNNDKESAIQTINHATNSIRRMSKLVDSLLNHAQIGTSSIFESINTHELLNEVISDLGYLIEETNAEITIADMPIIEGNIVEIRQLFQNLLNNALKYCEVVPEIKINYTDFVYQHQFEIIDNGIGISPNKAQDVFKMFNRLDAPKGISGSGIGLANCRKIVEAHGGKIWFSNNENGGTTFYFSINKNS